MEKMKAGFIGFVGFQEPDPYPVLESYAQIGFKGFESGDTLFRDGDPVENLKKVQSYGIAPLAMGMMSRPGEAPPTAAELIKKCKTIGVDRVATFAGCVGMFRFGMRPVPPSYDEVMQEIESFDALAKELSAEGIRFTFHNHDVEFTQTYRGVPAIFLMAANSEYLKFELDTGWAAYAGANPVHVLKKLGDRVSDIHIKDFVPGEVRQKMPNGNENIMPAFTAPGTGLLDMAGCLEAAQALGIEYAIVEQDFMRNLTPHETLTAAYLNMKETGFVE